MSRLRFLPVALLALVLMASGALKATAQQASPVAQGATPTPPTISATDVESVVAWGQWLFSFPAEINPGADATGAACGLGQHGSTFFLAPVSGDSEAMSRSCTIVQGTSVVVPVIAVDCSTAEADPFHGDDAESLASCAQANGDNITGGYASIDGAVVDDLTTFRLQTPVFSVVLPEGNVLAAPAGAASLVVDGVFLTLEDLAPGEHTIAFGGTYQNGGTLDVTYTITVVAAPVAVS